MSRRNRRIVSLIGLAALGAALLAAVYFAGLLVRAAVPAVDQLLWRAWEAVMR